MKRNPNKYLLLGIIMALVIALTGCGGAGVLPDDLTEGGSSNVVAETPDTGIEETQQAPQNIILSTQDVSCPVGQEMSIDISVEPADASNDLTITSNDPTIADIDSDGNIMARQRGTAVITIASELNPEVSTSVTVSVSATYESLGIDAEDLEVVENQEMGLVLEIPSEMTRDIQSTYTFLVNKNSNWLFISESEAVVSDVEPFSEIMILGEAQTVYKQPEQEIYVIYFSRTDGEQTRRYFIYSYLNDYEEVEALINGLSIMQ